MIGALVLVPIIVGIALYALPRRAERQAKAIALAVAVLSFIVAALSADLADESRAWFSRPFLASFHVGLGHGLAYWLVLLLALTTACALAASRLPRQRDFAAQMLILLGAMTGVFVARDLLLFALFWDLMLIPVFLIMVSWAPPGNSSSAWRYLIYNLAGGLALLLATAAYGIVVGSTDVLGKSVGPGLPEIGAVWAPWVFAGFAIAFLIKTPVWPLHTWMPDTYADLPPPVVAVVSAVQSKTGLYGFLAIALPLMPTAMREATGVMLALGTIGLVYGALIALVQTDAKRVVAYSSLSHLGLILIAIFSFVPIALAGAAVYMVAHGLFSAALFLVLGQVEQREETRSLQRVAGLGVRNPKLAGALALAALTALGLPGLAGFAGEILILTGLFKAGSGWITTIAVIALVTIVIAAAYMLRLYQGLMHGPEVADLPQRPDLTLAELLVLAPLVIAIVLLGINPGPVANSPTTTASAERAAVTIIGGIPR